MSNTAKGFALAISAALLYGVAPTIQKYALIEGASPLGLLIICLGSASVFLLICTLVKRESLRLTKRQLLPMLVVGLVGLLVTDLGSNIAYDLIPVGFATMIVFMYPAIVCVAMAVIFKEKMNKLTVIAAILTIPGLILIGNGGIAWNLMGVLAAVAAALAFTFYIIANERTAVAEVPEYARAFYFHLFVVIAALIIDMFTHSATYPTTPLPWAAGIISGIMLGSATLMFNMGIGILGPARTALLAVIEPVCSLVVSAIVYKYVISGITGLGCLCIIASLILVSFSNRAAALAAEGDEAPAADDAAA